MTAEPALSRSPASHLVTHPAVIALTATLIVIGAAGGAWIGSRAVPRYRSDALLAIEAPLHSSAQASVVATGADVVVKQVTADSDLAPDLAASAAGDLTLAAVPAGADRIRIEAEHSNPRVAERAVELAAMRVITAAAERRSAEGAVAPVAGNQPAAGPAESPQLVWARESLDAHLRRSPALPDDSARARDRDAMLIAIFERGVEAGRQGVAIEQGVSARVQSTLGDVTQSWYAFPLHLESPSSGAVSIQSLSIRRTTIGGMLTGLGAALLAIAMIGSVAAMRSTAARRRASGAPA